MQYDGCHPAQEKPIYILLRKKEGNIFAEGTPTYFQGHKIEKGRSREGAYIEWQWDGEKLTVRNDYYGLIPLYYCFTDEFVIFSPSVFTVLKKSGTSALDYEALSVFIRTGMYLDNDTPFKNIKTFSPNSTFSWSNGREEWDRGKFQPVTDNTITRKQIIECFIELFRKAIQKRPPPGDRFVLPLSGGRDSRHILFELAEQGFLPYKCMTTSKYPPAQSEEDIVIAKLITEKLGLRHEIIPPPAARFAAEISKNFKTGFCSDEHAWYLGVADRITNRFNTVYDGIGGDVLTDILGDGSCDLAFSELFAEGKYGDLTDKIVRRKERGIKRILHPKYYRFMDLETAAARLTTEVQKYSNCANPVSAFYFWNRTRRKIALIPYGILNSVEYTYSPYLDRDLFDFLVSLPFSALADNTLHTRVIEKAYPQFSDLPFEKPVKWELNTPGNIRHSQRFGKQVLFYLGRNYFKTSRILHNNNLMMSLASAQLAKKLCIRFGWLINQSLYLSHLDLVSQKAGELYQG